MSDWLSEIVELYIDSHQFPTKDKGTVYYDIARMARVIRELGGYVTFLEAYCSERMSAEKARKRFILSDDAKELLRDV